MKRELSLSVAATVAGAALIGVGLAVDPRQAMFSYLASWVFVVSVAVGALFWIAIAHATNATWMVVLRRRAEDVTSALPVIAALFLPVLASLPMPYPWARPESGWGPDMRRAVLPKVAYLNAPFFAGRAVFYLASWVLVAELLRRLSRAGREGRAGADLAGKQRSIAAVSLPILAFTLTFAAFDWLMSLDPTWSSNVFGVYLFGGGFGAAVGLLCFVSFGPLASRIPGATADQSHAMGRLLLTFVIFWAYIAFCQYLLIWIADLPDEVGWVKLRTTGSWGTFAVVLVGSHFVLPFFALLSRDVKRRPSVVAWMGAWLVVAHYLDVYWVVLPQLHAAFHPHWLDVAALLFVGGASTLSAILRARGEPSMPQGDPRLQAGLDYEAA
jgi:hypothetical protein